jgi:voltage-gated potassium channel
MTLPALLHKRLLKQRRFRQLLVLSILVCVIIGLIIVPIEAGAPHRKINDTSDGIWWAVQTLTTVGYGDVTPVTELGRVLGIVLLVLGTMMFGVVVATISSSMNRQQEEFYWNRLFERLDRIEEELVELQRKSEFLVKNQDKKE